ncbi:MAG: Ig-like domain-containing protein [Spirochaetota bacterium]|nr:Ig-like domain-containing protein [Spirochaetota bacterium]
MKRYSRIIITISIACSFALVLSCSDDSGSSHPYFPGDVTAPTSTVNPPSGATINNIQKIVLTFSESMDTGTLVLGGSMQSESDGGSWLNVTNENDTLTISPDTSWSEVVGATLTIDCDDLGGNSIDTISLSYDVDATASTITIVSPDNDSIIRTSQKIVITFSEIMDTGTLVLGGSMESEGDGGVWTDADSILTISPNPTWTDGSGRTLTIDCDDLVGNSVATISLTYNVDAAVPTVISVSPTSDLIILTSQTIVITFSESMDTGTLVLGGSMESEGDGGSWSNDTFDNDTLTISPGSEWTVGEGRTLTIVCRDLVGNQLSTLSLSYQVLDVEGIIYVSDANGDDGYPGSIAQPKKTIQAGIDEADALYSIAAVMVAKGTYSKDYYNDGAPVVTLIEGVSIYGGYSNDFTERDTDLHKTILEDTSAAGGISNIPNRAVYGDGSISNATVVDGFTINGGGGNHSSAVFNNNGASPTITNNRINGGVINNTSAIINNNGASPIITNNIIDGGSGNYSFGIRNFNSSSPVIYYNALITGGIGNTSHGINNTSSSPEILNNTIEGGDGVGGYSYGIYNQSSSSPTIRNNMIDGGNGSVLAFGIRNLSSSPTIQNNTIYGGNSTNSFGIENSSLSSPDIQNNTIDGGDGGTSIGINIESLASDHPSPRIENNIIFTSGGSNRRGINEQDADADPATLRNNDIFDCPTALYYDEHTTAVNDLDSTIVSTDEGSGTLGSWSNVSVDPEFADRAGGDLHLTASSPVSVTAGGLDLSGEFVTDKDGNNRTAPWSIGAYEYGATIYVSQSLGNDAYPGTMAQPKKTIQAGIDEAYTLYSIAAVVVAEGTYSKDYNDEGTPVVTLQEGVSIYGGYSNDFTERDIALYETIIEDTSISGGPEYNNPNRAVFGDAGISNGTVVDGFTIIGGSGDYTSAIFNDAGSSPTIRNNNITGGTGSIRSYGICNDYGNSSTVIQNNIIHGGEGGDISEGIANFGSTSTINDNTIDGGNGNESRGISMNFSSLMSIERNIIKGGDGSNYSKGVSISDSSSIILRNNVIEGGSIGNNSYGVDIGYNSTATMQNNTINAGSGSAMAYGIRIGSNTTPTIENNIILSSVSSNGYGIFEITPGSDPASLRNNNIFDCPTALYHDHDTALNMKGVDGGNFTENENGTGTALATPTGSGNISEDISDYLDAEYRFDDIIGPLHLSDFDFDTNGLDGDALGWGFGADRDGASRTGNGAIGWSIGAYEYD